MRTVDPLGRHDDCARILEAVDAGRRVVLVGHPLLGSEAVRRRVSHTRPSTPGQGAIAFLPMRAADPATTTCTVLSDDDSLDTRRAVPLDDDGVMVVRLARLSRRQFDRLADDRLARAGLRSTWLGATCRSIVHAQSRGYPLLAAALLDDRLRPERPSRTASAAGAIVRALDAELRSAAEAIAAVPGVRVGRAAEHLGGETVDALLHVGIVDEVAGSLVVPTVLRVPLAQRQSERGTAILDEIVGGWARRDAGTASEYVAAHDALEAGTISADPIARARIAAIAAVTFAGRALGARGAAAAAVALRHDPTTLPTALTALRAGDDAIVAPILRDAHAAGFDDFASRLVAFAVTSSVLAPDPAGAALEHLLPAHAECRARLVRTGELARAQAALESGDHDALAAAAQAALVGGDPLVGLRAYGILACDAAFRGDAEGVLAAADGVHGILGQVQDGTRILLAAAARAIAETRMAARVLALPPLPLLDAALDRVVESAAASDDAAGIAFGLLSRIAEAPDLEQVRIAETLLLELPDEGPRRMGVAAIAALRHGPSASEVPCTIIAAGRLAELVTTAEHATGATAREALERAAASVEAGMGAHVPLRIAVAALRARLGDAVPDLSDIDAARLSPVLRALLVLTTAPQRRDVDALVAAAASIVSARHAALTRSLLDAARALDDGAPAIARIEHDLETSIVAARRTLRGSRAWIDRDLVGLAAAGMTDLQISQLLELPLGTIRSRSRAMMSQLGVPRREGLAAAR